MQGFQNIIIDGVTMKKTDNQYDSRTNARVTTGSTSTWHEQYHFARGLREDDHTRATLHYADIEFANEDSTLNDTGYTDDQKMCGVDMLARNNMDKPMFFYGGTGGSTTKDQAGTAGHYQGYTDSYQPLKPCASWCALDQFSTASTDEILSGRGVDHSRQVYTSGTPGTLNSLSSQS